MLKIFHLENILTQTCTNEKFKTIIFFFISKCSMLTGSHKVQTQTLLLSLFDSLAPVHLLLLK